MKPPVIPFVPLILKGQSLPRCAAPTHSPLSHTPGLPLSPLSIQLSVPTSRETPALGLHVSWRVVWVPSAYFTLTLAVFLFPRSDLPA